MVGQASSRRSLIKWFISDDLGRELVADSWNIWKYGLLVHCVVGPYIFTLYMIFIEMFETIMMTFK